MVRDGEIERRLQDVDISSTRSITDDLQLNWLIFKLERRQIIIKIITFFFKTQLLRVGAHASETTALCLCLFVFMSVPQ